MFESHPIFKPIASHPSCHCATIIETPAGDLLAAWYAGAYERARDQAIFWSRLARGASNWSVPEILVDTPDRADGQPLFFYDTEGRLWFLWVTIEGEGWTEASIKYQVSGDDGQTWGPVCFLRKEWEWMARNKPIVLGNGEILLPLYDERRWSSLFLISGDAGKTWDLASEVITEPGNIQATVIQRADDSLYCLMRTGGQGGWLWQTTSFDRGWSWSPAEPGPFPNPNAAIDMVRLHSGHLVLAFNNTPHGRTPLNVALSLDEGRSWPFVRTLEDGPGEYSYPAIIQARDGLIHLVYTYRRETIQHTVFDETWFDAGGGECAGKAAA